MKKKLIKQAKESMRAKKKLVSLNINLKKLLRI